MGARTLRGELRDVMKQLRLGQLLPTLAERITLAEKQEMPLEDFLLGLFTDEVQRRRSAAATRRAYSAGLDPDMVFELGQEHQSQLRSTRVAGVQQPAFHRGAPQRRDPGSRRCRQTLVASALAHVACSWGFNVRFHRADDLLRSLRQSRLDNSREAVMTELSTVDVLVVDDFALEPMNRDESRDIYQGSASIRKRTQSVKIAADARNSSPVVGAAVAQV